jgi:pimeloyl-ACP methyl ester carboxylesterase
MTGKIYLDTRMKPLLLLHGALGAADHFDALKKELGMKYDVHTLDFSGHGQSPASPDSFSIAAFGDDVLKLIAEKGWESISIFGYSMGGYVALYLAKHHPEKIKEIVTLATKLHWDEATSVKEAGMLNPEKIEAKVPQLANALKQRHQDKDWKTLLNKTADMMLAMGKDSPLKSEDYSAIQQPVTLLLGDRDKMVSLDETLAVYKLLPNAKMGMLPGTQHPIEQVNPKLLGYFIDILF